MPRFARNVALQNMQELPEGELRPHITKQFVHSALCC